MALFRFVRSVVSCDRRRCKEQGPLDGSALPLLARTPLRTATPESEPSSAPAATVDSFADINATGPAAAAKLKERGNDAFRKQDFPAALLAYSESILLYAGDDSVWVNRSIVNRQLKAWGKSEADARKAAELAPGSTKAFYSLALALQCQKRLPEAREACEAGLHTDPEHRALAQLHNVLRREEEAAAAKGREEVAAAARAAAAEPACPADLVTAEEKKQIVSAAEYVWQEDNPSPADRWRLRTMMVDMFRKRYNELDEEKRAAMAARQTPASKQTSKLNLDQYSKQQKLGLQIQGGHLPLDRPDDVILPPDYLQPIGVITAEQLAGFGADNEAGRHLLSIWGDVFDLSDRPDKYSSYGPYLDLTGRDITWGLITGNDSGDLNNRFYDLFKAKDQGVDKMGGVCSWLAWYETEYGKPVGRLAEYEHEEKLPMPALDECEDVCVVM